MKIVTVVGARPQFVKASAVSLQLRCLPSCQEVLVHTGQHYDKNLSDIFFRELDIDKPKYNLSVGSGSHASQTGKAMYKIESILLQEKPDVVVVYGDTNSTLAAAIAAAKIHIPVAHIEAGLRSFNRRMPEEINRVLTDHSSDVLYTPTQQAKENLLREGISPDKIKHVGDVMYDATLRFSQHSSAMKNAISSDYRPPKPYALATIHRAENTDNKERLSAIFSALVKLAKTLPVILPLHPRTRKALNSIKLLNTASSRLKVIPPVGYLDMLEIEKDAKVIITDSGGVQKEAFFHRVPCVTLRDETEWTELVDLGWNKLVPPRNELQIIQGVLSTLNQPTPTEDNNITELYGGGNASRSIAVHLQERFGD